MPDHRITRRGFLQLAGVSAAGLAVPSGWMPGPGDEFTPAGLIGLPNLVREVLTCTPDCRVDQDGYLVLPGPSGRPPNRSPQARTEWNLEKCLPVHRLDTPARWAIVLHWFGDRPGYDRTLTGYLRGFDEIRPIAGNLTRTSSHFLVGDARPSPVASQTQIGLLQTQAPGPGGIPFLASHLQSRLDYLAHQEKRQYFVRAFYQLATGYPRLRSVLQDWFDGSSLDPNWRSLAVDLTGADFEQPGGFPPAQQIGNALGLIWALMKRYNLQAADVLGHHEIQMDKPDAGKKFLAVLRLLLGVRAITSGDGQMGRLVFGQFDGSAEAYFRFQREHLALVGRPAQVYDWEKTASYWQVVEAFFGRQPNSGSSDLLAAPLEGRLNAYSSRFLSPETHAGVDLFPTGGKAKDMQARLAAGGECLHAGWSNNAHPGKTAVFRHRRPDGTTLLTLYSHLEELGDIQMGSFYPQGYPVGSLRRAGSDCFLHFAVALGSAWEYGLSTAPDLPPGASPDWIRERFLDPLTCVLDLIQ